MNVSLNLTDALIIGLIVVTIILVIYLIVLAARLKETLRKVDDILDDANRISKIAAEKTEVIDGVIDNAADTMMGIVETVHENSSLIGKVASVGTGAAAIRSHRAKKRSRKGRSGIQPRKCSEVPKKIDFTGHCSDTNKQFCKYYFYK